MQFEEYRPAAGPLTTRGMKKTSRSLQHSHKMKQVTVPLALDDQKQPKKTFDNLCGNELSGQTNP